MRYDLRPSESLPNWWVLTDKENNVVLRFEAHRFNETQKVSLLDDSKITATTVQSLATILREMGDWMFEHHYGLIFPTPVYELQTSEDDGKLYLLRNKPPRFRMEIQDTADANSYAAALRKAAEYLTKRTER